MAVLLAHAALGRRIFPTAWLRPDGSCSCGNKGCIKQGKHPRIQEWQTRATTDWDQINEWHSWVPLANWGWLQDVTFTLDVDVKRNGLVSLSQWEDEVGGLAVTYTQRTRSGGWHFVYRQTDPPVRQQGDVIEGIEIRGLGSYIMLGDVSDGWTIVDPNCPVGDADELTLALIERHGLLLEQGETGKKMPGAAGDTKARLPATEWFIVNGFGGFSGSRNRDAYRLAWRLLQHMESRPELWTVATVTKVMHDIWKRTEQGESPFPWDECLGSLQSAWRRREKQRLEREARQTQLAASILAGMK